VLLDITPPGNSTDISYIASFNGELRDELLNRQLFYTSYEAQVLVEHRCVHYNRVRPHSALGYRPPAPETIMPLPPTPERILPLPAA
jgi:putative transposase